MPRRAQTYEITPCVEFHCSEQHVSCADLDLDEATRLIEHLEALDPGSEEWQMCAQEALSYHQGDDESVVTSVALSWTIYGRDAQDEVVDVLDGLPDFAKARAVYIEATGRDLERRPDRYTGLPAGKK